MPGLRMAAAASAAWRTSLYSSSSPRTPKARAGGQVSYREAAGRQQPQLAVNDRPGEAASRHPDRQLAQGWLQHRRLLQAQATWCPFASSARHLNVRANRAAGGGDGVATCSAKLHRTLRDGHRQSSGISSARTGSFRAPAAAAHRPLPAAARPPRRGRAWPRSVALAAPPATAVPRALFASSCAQCAP